MEPAEKGQSVKPNVVERLLGKVHQGDCIEEMRKLRDGCIDLAFADPPFNIGYAYDQYKDRLAHDEYLAWSEAWMGEVFRVLKPDGTFWLAIGDEYAAELKLAAQKVGFWPRSWVIWYYTFGVHCKTKFTRSHAHLFYFVKDSTRFTFNAQAVAVPSARQRIYADSRANPDGRMPDDTWILRPRMVFLESGRNVWRTRWLSWLPDARTVVGPYCARLLQSRRDCSRSLFWKRYHGRCRKKARTAFFGL
jgi:DNA methylase